jgi:valyl-tRNA synthetase
MYDEKKNLVKTTFNFFNFLKKKEGEKNIKYLYDNKNRLTKRIIYHTDDALKDMAEEIEEYSYENGKFIYYPFLLPPKIKMFLMQQNENAVDKFVF